ncbi:MAG: hypothetical protein ACREQ4_10920 [Candidatus Binataceae bacterium]
MASAGEAAHRVADDGGVLSAVLLILGLSPVAVTQARWSGAFGSWLAFTDTLPVSPSARISSVRLSLK